MMFERGFLRKPAVTRVLDRLWAEDLEDQRRKQRNDDIYSAAITAWFRRTDPPAEAVGAQRQEH